MIYRQHFKPIVYIQKNISTYDSWQSSQKISFDNEWMKFFTGGLCLSSFQSSFLVANSIQAGAKKRLPYQ